MFSVDISQYIPIFILKQHEATLWFLSPPWFYFCSNKSNLPLPLYSHDITAVGIHSFNIACYFPMRSSVARQTLPPAPARFHSFCMRQFGYTTPIDCSSGRPCFSIEAEEQVYLVHGPTPLGSFTMDGHLSSKFEEPRLSIRFTPLEGLPSGYKLAGARIGFSRRLPSSCLPRGAARSSGCDLCAHTQLRLAATYIEEPAAQGSTSGTNSGLQSPGSGGAPGRVHLHSGR